MYMYIYTWNLCVLYFGASTLQNKAISNQNSGHLGSRYNYIVIPLGVLKSTLISRCPLEFGKRHALFLVGIYISWTIPGGYSLVLRIPCEKVFRYLKPTPKPLVEGIGA